MSKDFSGVEPILHCKSIAKGTTDPRHWSTLTITSEQKLQQALKSWSNFSLVLFGPRREIHRQIHVTTLRNPYFDIYVLTTCRNQRNNFDYSMLQLNKFNEFALLQHLALFGLAKALVPYSDSVKRQ